MLAIPQPSTAELNDAVKENQDLKDALAVQEKAFGEFRANGDFGQASIAELEKQLAEAEKSRDELARKLADLSAPQTIAADNSPGIKPSVFVTGMRRIDLLLVKNRVVPIQDPFFTVYSIRVQNTQTGQISPGVKISRVSDGAPVGEAIIPVGDAANPKGGLLSQLLMDEDPTKAIVYLHVCADSISAFRTIIAAITKPTTADGKTVPGFKYAWDTANDEDIIQAKSASPANPGQPSAGPGVNVYSN